MKLRHTIAAVAAAATLITLSACSSPSSPATAGGKTTLTYQYFNNQPAAIAATKAIVADWNKANPDVHVNLVQAPADNLQDKLTTQFSGGVAPDIIQNDAPSDILPFAGYLADLSKLLPSGTLSDIDPAAKKSLTAGGKLIAAPTEVQTYVVFANKKLLEQSGVSIPTGNTMTWDTFENIAKQTTKDGVRGLTWGLKSPTSVFAYLGTGFGAKYFTGGGSDSKAVFGNAELQVPERVQSMIKSGYVDPTGVTQSSSDVLATFYGGKAAMTVAGSYQIANIESEAPAGFDWAVLPALEGSKSASQLAAPITLSVNAKSKNVQAAADFVNFYLKGENLAKINLADGQVPPTTSGLAALSKLTAGKNGWAQVLASGKNLVTPAFNNLTKYSNWKTTIATPGYQQFLAGQITSDQLSKQLVDGWTQLNQ
ncbi:sugar ABC transporter substrate-binding protein [Leifsonia shinshuensis]|uniref:ABC transporter substrate-binding protein n=1 Tax=Leifsonia shinshuensis TaxID=150026 RepID=UPI001F506132|nr:sugar ABC transporter substrate-binding protein [Leifsonia shinshuensis]MCI0157092.1 sugar ABC transporter substrate-binding protein [Leifsonia shinshuensis]